MEMRAIFKITNLNTFSSCETTMVQGPECALQIFPPASLMAKKKDSSLGEIETKAAAPLRGPNSFEL